MPLGDKDLKSDLDVTSGLKQLNYMLHLNLNLLKCISLRMYFFVFLFVYPQINIQQHKYHLNNINNICNSTMNNLKAQQLLWNL